MRTATNAYITASGLRAGKRLPLMEAWANSSLAVTAKVGNAMLSATLRVTDTASGVYLAPVAGVLHPKRGEWYFYMNKRNFPHGGEGLYKLYGTDTHGGRWVVGEGTLRVYRGRTLDPMDEAGGAETTDNAYIRHDGAWYRVEVLEGEDGEPMFAVRGVAENGVPQGVDGDAYAYNRATGLYHKVIVGTDDVGEIMLRCADEGVEGDETTFAYQHATGFYYRIDCAVDDTGATMLQVGGKQT